MAAIFMLGNSNVNGAQRISTLAAVSPHEERLMPQSSLDDYMKAVKYENIASVIRQYDKAATTPNSTASVSNHSMSFSVQPMSSKPNKHI